MTTIITENKVTTVVTVGTQGPQGIQGPPGDASAIAWGTLTGTLSNQTDLNSALSGKSDTGHTHTGTYEPADATILKDADIGVSVAPQIHTHSYEPANANIQTHIGTTGNPHGVTKSDVGLANVDNTSDVNKPVSTATQTALDLKVDETNGTAAGLLVTTAKSITFDATHVEAGAAGRLKWNDTDGTLDLGLKGGNVTLQVGQEQVIRVLNKTGGSLNNAQVIYATAASGHRVEVALAQANSEASSSKTLAVLTENVSNNQEGFATTHGLVRDIDTSTLTEGGAVWLSPSTAGGMTSTRPAAPNHAVFIGWCTHQHLTQGSIFVHIQNGYELDELHDVLITGVQSGHIISWDGSKWVNSAPTAPTSSSVAASYTASGTTTIAYSADAVYYATCATAGTTWAITGLPSSGTIGSWTVELTNGGLFTQTWFANTKWDGGTIPTLTSSGVDILTFYTRDGGTTIRGFVAAKDSK